jgi:hypothetical protein
MKKAKKTKDKLTYGGKPHICFKTVPFVASHTPLNSGVSICSVCNMTVDSKEDKKYYEKSKTKKAAREA